MCTINRPYKDGNEFNGIVYYFNNIRGHSFDDFITANGSTFQNWGPPTTLINYSITGTNASDQWVSPNNESEAFVVLKFEYPIFITNYTLQTRTDTDEKVALPKSWSLTCSFDGINYFPTSDITSDILLNHRIGTFPVNTSTICQYVKFQMTSNSSNGSWHFHLSRVELYGSVISLSNDLCPHFTCRNTFIGFGISLILAAQIFFFL